MPTLPPGTANNVNLSFTPTWLFTPSTSATNNVRLWNNGRNTVYVGRRMSRSTPGCPSRPAASRLSCPVSRSRCTGSRRTRLGR